MTGMYPPPDEWSSLSEIPTIRKLATRHAKNPNYGNSVQAAKGFSYGPLSKKKLKKWRLAKIQAKEAEDIHEEDDKLN